MSDIVVLLGKADEQLPILRRARFLNTYFAAPSLKDRDSSSVLLWLVLYASPSAWLFLIVRYLYHLPVQFDSYCRIFSSVKQFSKNCFDMQLCSPLQRVHLWPIEIFSNCSSPVLTFCCCFRCSLYLLPYNSMQKIPPLFPLFLSLSGPVSELFVLYSFLRLAMALFSSVILRDVCRLCFLTGC
ncbi:hypothetical protein RvY_14575 [Ramazzottius varieornatus]|uniref:Uncharacterized protein n=1 Tax=Ramazzottius varieornatus TaxID=947166 RepID=A0A1D1VWW1_RAMVA|nr:hypothetical protein RvY_14575 [Ramazzottius varieornatus]